MTATTTAPTLPAVAGDLAHLRHRDARRGVVVLVGLVAVLVALAAVALTAGAVPLSPGQLLGALTDPAAEGRFVVTGLRLPRLALGVVVGGALGLAGALLQSVVRNPLASPDIVGITGGAGAAAVLAISAGASGAAVESAALGGALAAAAAVFLLSGRGVTGARFVVIGVAVAFFAQGLIGYGLTRANLTQAESAYFWLVGSVGTAPWSDVLPLAAVLAVTGTALALARRPLSVLALDDDTARSLGVRPVGTRMAIVVTSSVLAALAVAVAGPVAFVAFVSGPLARRMRGSGPALATSALVGAVVVVAADLLAQHALPGPLQPPAGLVTGALGAPFLLWILVRGERRKDTPA